MKKISLYIFIAAFLLTLPGIAPADEWDKALVRQVEDRFTPTQPAILVDYDIDYRFLFIKLLSLARANVRAVKGTWLNSATGEKQKALLLKAKIDSGDDPESEDRRRVSTHRHITAVLKMPEAETLVYIKKADEYVNPLFKNPKEAKYREIYDMQSGQLRFIRRDYLNDTVQTNLVGAQNLARQGEEIATTLKIISDVYHGRREMLDKETDVTVDINIDGVVTPFRITTEKDEAPVRINDEDLPCLRTVIRPTEEAEGRGSKAIVWAMSFRDLAEIKGDPELMAVAETTKKWSMVPLAADYGLALGYVRAGVTGVTVRPPPGDGE
jgi:hypothetical protein